jgi:capsular polysaccharide transport system ATP-binding protein
LEPSFPLPQPLILLEHIWKSYGRGRKAKEVLTDLDATLDFSSGNIGVLGSRKSGKTTLLNIIAGAIQPDHGRIKRRLRISWPLSWRGIGKGMTGDAQVAFLARLYQADRQATLRYVAELSGLDRKLYASMASYSAREKDRLMLALAFALDFDLYLVDEALPRMQPEYQASYDAAWSDRLQGSRMLVVTSKPAHLNAACAHAAILREGMLSELMPATEAVTSYRQEARERRMTK